MRDLPPNLIAALAVFATVGLGVLALALAWEWWRDRARQKEIARRLTGIATPGEGAGASRDPFSDLFRQDAAAAGGWLDGVVAKLPHTRDLGTLLQQADVGMRVGTFFLATLGAAAATGMAAFVFTHLWFVGLAAASLGASAPYLWVKRKKRTRLDALEEHFPEAIDLLGRAIRAGHAFSTGLQMVADESPEPIATEFRQVFEEQKFGLPIEDTLLGLADRVDLLDMRLFVTAVLIQREVGGNLAEILDKIAYTIRERFTIERQVRVYTAQGRFTGYLLAGLPLAVGGLIWMLNPEYMSVLFTEPAGRLMITVAAILQIAGFFIIRRIIDIEI